MCREISEKSEMREEMRLRHGDALFSLGFWLGHTLIGQPAIGAMIISK